MPAAPAIPASGDVLMNVGLALEDLLGRYIAAHERMLMLTAEHRQAVSKGDGVRIAQCSKRLAEMTSEIADLDAERRRIASRLNPAPGPTAPGGQPTLTELAQRLPEPIRARVLLAASKLKDLLAAIQRESQSIQTATRTLLSHMDGLIQQVVRTVNRARVYGASGKLVHAGPIVAGIDLVR